MKRITISVQNFSKIGHLFTKLCHLKKIAVVFPIPMPVSKFYSQNIGHQDSRI